MNIVLVPKSSKDAAKLLLVPLLCSVLVFLMRGKSEEPAADAVPPAANMTPSVATQAVADKPAWPKADLQDILSFNPFEQPTAIETATQADSSDVVSEAVETAEATQPLVAPRVQAIYFDAQGAAAILNAKVVRVGDLLPTGQRIVEISNRGIRLD